MTAPKIRPGDWFLHKPTNSIAEYSYTFTGGRFVFTETAMHGVSARNCVRLPFPPADLLRITKAAVRWQSNRTLANCGRLLNTIERAQAKARNGSK